METLVTAGYLPVRGPLLVQGYLPSLEFGDKTDLPPPEEEDCQDREGTLCFIPHLFSTIVPSIHSPTAPKFLVKYFGVNSTFVSGH